MKIIFLDFDGVILTLRTCVAHDKPAWSNAEPDPVLVNVLRRCCERTNFFIVVSSTWRTHEPTCKAKLEECGLIKFLHADWRTIEKHHGEAAESRPAEIAEWLSRHPEVESYRILDDDAWTWTAEQKPNELKCCPEDGASARVMLALLEWAGLRKKPTIEPATPEETQRYATQTSQGNA